MKKHENFCAALKNLKEIYNYEQPYDSVVLTGLVGLFEICFEPVSYTHLTLPTKA